jgi:hypothetical protein
MMASKSHRLFEILWRLRRLSGRFVSEFRGMLLIVTYLAAALGLFWLMGTLSTHMR